MSYFSHETFFQDCQCICTLSVEAYLYTNMQLACQLQLATSYGVLLCKMVMKERSKYLTLLLFSFVYVM
jgi:hypothetical protein